MVYLFHFSTRIIYHFHDNMMSLWVGRVEKIAKPMINRAIQKWRELSPCFMSLESIKTMIIYQEHVETTSKHVTKRIKALCETSRVRKTGKTYRRREERGWGNDTLNVNVWQYKLFISVNKIPDIGQTKYEPCYVNRIQTILVNV